MNQDIQNILLDVGAIQYSTDQHEINFLKQRIEIACRALVGTDVEYDKGPWSAYLYEDQVGLSSDDFTHDVSLRINGDFYNNEAKLAYAKKIADQLNQNTKNAAKPKLTARTPCVPSLVDDGEPLYSQQLVDSTIDAYTRNRSVTWHFQYSNSSGIGTSVDLVFSDGKIYDVTNYDLW